MDTVVSDTCVHGPESGQKPKSVTVITATQTQDPPSTWYQYQIIHMTKLILFFSLFVSYDKINAMDHK